MSDAGRASGEPALWSIPGWDEPGLPGWYAGHLVPASSMRITDAAAWDLDGGGTPTDPVWPPA